MGKKSRQMKACMFQEKKTLSKCNIISWQMAETNKRRSLFKILGRQRCKEWAFPNTASGTWDEILEEILGHCSWNLNIMFAWFHQDRVRMLCSQTCGSGGYAQVWGGKEGKVGVCWMDQGGVGMTLGKAYICPWPLKSRAPLLSPRLRRLPLGLVQEPPQDGPGTQGWRGVLPSQVMAATAEPITTA